MAITWKHFSFAGAGVWWIMLHAGAPVVPLVVGTAAVAGWNVYRARKASATR
ncbi:MAG: hypothetical protein ABI972_12300 [Acidobacteriota bacterium]